MAVTLTTEEVVAIAEEAKGYQQKIAELESENRKLRHELAMAKADYFATQAQRAMENDSPYISARLYRIAEAYEARAANLYGYMNSMPEER